MRVAERLAAARISVARARPTALARSPTGASSPPQEVLRLGELYRSACTDLMLADDHDLPARDGCPSAGARGPRHNLVYRAAGFQFRDLGRALFYWAPRRLRHDPALRLATLVFWGVFLFSALLSAGALGFRPADRGRAVSRDLRPHVCRAGNRPTP